MEKLFVYRDSVVGSIGIGESEGYITHLVFADEDHLTDCINSPYIIEETPLIKSAKKQLEEYFNGSRRSFDLPLMLEGTDFQKKVWSALEEIPYGETRSYKEIGEKIGCPKGCRAVGHANNRNPVSVIIPCHRVIGANGKLVGYGGGLDIKEKLLRVEGIIPKNDNICSLLRGTEELK